MRGGAAQPPPPPPAGAEDGGEACSYERHAALHRCVMHKCAQRAGLGLADLPNQASTAPRVGRRGRARGRGRRGRGRGYRGGFRGRQRVTLGGNSSKAGGSAIARLREKLV